MTDNPLAAQGYYLHPQALVEEPCQIGPGTQIWPFARVMAGAKIGANCNIGQGVFVDTGVVLGNRIKVQNNVLLYSGVTCEDDVFLGPSVVFTNVLTPRSAYPRKDQFRATFIGRGATIGASSTIVCGHKIGCYALVGAGCVVTRDVPDFALVVGNPARCRGWVCCCGEKLIFASALAACSLCGRQYAKEASALIRLLG